MALASEITRCCSITNCPSRSMHAVNSLGHGVTRDDRINHSVVPTSPACAQWTCCIMLVLHCRFTTRQLTHTLWSAGMTGTPLRVCAPSPLPSSGTLCCWLKQTLSVANPHPPDGRLQDAVYSPASVHTTPASQSGPVEQKTVWPTPHALDGRLQDAVHSPVSVHTTPASQSGPAPSLTLSRRQVRLTSLSLAIHRQQNDVVSTPSPQ